MPAPTVSTAPDRADLRSRLLGAQFWVGIGLAPIAVLLLLFGGTAAAAVLAIIAVVVLALSVMLRSDLSSTRESGASADEMNALRDDVRADITTAARATHRALSEKMLRLEESVAGVARLAESFAGIPRLEDAIAGVQRQVEAARAVAIEARAAVDNQRELPVPPPHRPATAVGSVPGVVRHTETVVTRSMFVDQPADDFEPPRSSGSTVYGSAARSATGRAAIGGVVNGSTTYGSPSRRRDGAPDHDSDDDGSHRAGRHDAARRDEVDHAAGSRGSGRPSAGRDDASRHDARRDDGGSHDAGRGHARWVDRDVPSAREQEFREREPSSGRLPRDEPRSGWLSRDEPREQEFREREPRSGSLPRDEPRSGSLPRDEPRSGSFPRDERREQEFRERGPREPRAGSVRRDEPPDRDELLRRDEPRADELRWGETPREPWRELSSGRDGRDDADDRDDPNESWTEQRLRAYLPQLRGSLRSRSGGGRDDLDSRDDLANDARWSQMRDGDRWAEVRSDDRGRELRMAERHAERHVDETGTQLRIVDRWSTVREERIPGTSDWSPAPETRAERRRRAEHDDRDETYPAAARAELPGPRHAPDDVRAERSSGNTGRGWRDVRSGVIEPDHSDGYEDSRYERPSHDWSAYDSSARDRSAYDRPAYDRPAYDSAAHDDVGIYRRRSDERPASGRAPALDVRPDPNAAGWTEDRTAGRRESRDVPPARRDSGEFAPPNRRDSGDFPPAWRDSGEFAPASRRDSGDFPPARRAEPVAYDEPDDRWVREPSQRSTGHRPRLDFEVTDDRWN